MKARVWICGSLSFASHIIPLVFFKKKKILSADWSWQSPLFCKTFPLEGRVRGSQSRSADRLDQALSEAFSIGWRWRWFFYTWFSNNEVVITGDKRSHIGSFHSKVPLGAGSIFWTLCSLLLGVEAISLSCWHTSQYGSRQRASPRKYFLNDAAVAASSSDLTGSSVEWESYKLVSTISHDWWFHFPIL